MRVGAYEVLDVIGKGGSSFVARARAPDGATVAIKLLRRGGAHDNVESEAVRTGRFDRERRLASALGETEGFVPLLDAGESGLGSYFVMPFLAGGTLRERLASGPLRVAETVALGRELARALGQAHARGIVHRDMKPENVLFSAAGRPLVADLGIAKHFRDDVAGASQSRSLTAVGTICGTFQYMAPEQFEATRDVDARADIFSLGVMLYECLAGSVPYAGDTPLDIVGRVAREERMPLARARAETPPWLATTVERCLSVDPARRFADGHALARALDAGGSARRRRPLAGILVTLGVVAAVAGASAGALMARTPRHYPPPLPTPPPPPPPGPGTIAPRAVLASSWGSFDRKHGAMVSAVAFDETGRRVVSSSLDGTCRIWDLEGREEPVVFPGHRTGVYPVAFVDERRAVSGGADGAIRIWERATGKELRAFKTSAKLVWQLVVSPDHRTIYTSSSDGKIEVWDPDSGFVRAFEGHLGTSGGVAVSPSGRMLVSGSNTGTVQLWDTGTGREINRLPLDSPTPVVAVSPSGLVIATGSEDGVARLFDVTTRQEIRSLEPTSRAHARTTDKRIGSVAFSPDGEKLLVSCFDGLTRLWNAASGELLLTLEGHAHWATGCAISPDGTRAATGSNDQSVRIWDLATGHELLASKGHATKIVGLAVAPDGAHALGMSWDGAAKLWDTESGRETWSGGGEPTRARGVGLLPDGDAVVARTDGVQVYDPSGHPRGLLAKEAPSTAIACAPVGSEVVAGGMDGMVRVFSGGARVANFRHGEAVASVAVSADGRHVASGGESGRIEVWGLVPPGRERTVAGEGAPIIALAFAGSSLLAADARGKLSVNEADGRTRSFDVGDVGELVGAAFAPDGSLAVALGASGTCSLVALDDGRELTRIPPDDLYGRGLAAAFSPDGKWFLVGTEKGVILRFTIAGR